MKRNILAALAGAALGLAMIGLVATAGACQLPPPVDEACNLLIINNLADGPPLVVALRQGEREEVFNDHVIAPGQYIAISLDCEVPEVDVWVANNFERANNVYRRVTTPPQGKTAVWCFGPCPFPPSRTEAPRDTVIRFSHTPVVPEGLQPGAPRAA